MLPSRKTNVNKTEKERNESKQKIVLNDLKQAN